MQERGLGGCFDFASREIHLYRGHKEQHIIIVGAGIAGLGAAEELSRHGAQVLVLEARDRMGGRIATDWSLGLPIELGANWIEGNTGNPISSLAMAAGAKVRRTKYGAWALFDAEGRRVSRDRAQEISLAISSIVHHAKEILGEASKNISLRDAVEHLIDREEPLLSDTTILEWGLASLAIETGADAGDLSLGALSEQDVSFGDNDGFVTTGCNRICEFLGKHFPIQFGQVVRRISYSTKGVYIETERDGYSANAAVITVPLGVLKTGGIEFVPALPKKKRLAICSMGMGLVNKIIMEFPRDPFPKAIEFISLMDKRPIYREFMNLRPYIGRPLVVGWAGGESARILESLEDAQVLAEALNALKNVIGRTLPDPTATYITRWNQDQFAKGSFSFLPPGTTREACDILGEPVDNRLFFGGEATDGAHLGTMQGAYLSGLREARRILRLFS